MSAFRRLLAACAATAVLAVWGVRTSADGFAPPWLPTPLLLAEAPAELTDPHREAAEPGGDPSPEQGSDRERPETQEPEAEELEAAEPDAEDKDKQDKPNDGESPQAAAAEAVPALLAPGPLEGVPLAHFEALALAVSPAVAEASARVRESHGNALQAGLPPNPTIGYAAAEMGADGRAGQQGLYVGQEFVRGHKLELSRQVECREAQRRAQRLAAARLRVLTNVRTAYFDAAIAEREVATATQLIGLSREAVGSATDLLKAEEGRKIDVLQAEIEAEQAAIGLRQAQARLDAAWRRLGALCGLQGAAPSPLAADLTALRWEYGWEQTVEGLLAQSPELAEASAEVARARAALRRACAEPTPNVTTQATVQYDAAGHDTLTGVQVTWPLPLWNRNQGGIAAARAALTAACRARDAVAQRLRTELAAEVERYQVADARVQGLRAGVLGRAEQNMQLVTQAYQAGELPYLDLLTAYRTYYQANLAYLTALQEVNVSLQRIDGLLLSGFDALP